MRFFFGLSRITGTQVVFRWRQIRTGRGRRGRRGGRHSSDGLALVQSRVTGRIHGPSFSQRRQYQPRRNVRHHGPEASLESTPEKRGQKERQEGGQEPTGLRELCFASFGFILCYSAFLTRPMISSPSRNFHFFILTVLFFLPCWLLFVFHIFCLVFHPFLFFSVSLML